MNPHAVLLLLLVSCASATGTVAASPPGASPQGVADAQAGIDSFNRSMIDATTRMDSAALLALWEDDGVSLIPETKPMVGKKAIASFVAEVTAQLPGAHMISFEMHCAGVEVSGDVATEYCDEHQVVDLGAGKPPFDGAGELLFVLHRGTDRTWRLRREMWNQGVKARAQSDAGK